MLDALMDGSAHPAGELARLPGIAASTASSHLARLHTGGLVSYEAHGRKRLYRLAPGEIAEILEALARLAPPAETRSLQSANRDTALRFARTCYDHLAGYCGVNITQSLVERGALLPRDTVYELTASGEVLMARLGVDVVAARTRHRAFARACLDWSERRSHLAGALGAALADTLISRGWLARRPNDRALTVTPTGAAALRRDLGVELAR